MEIQPDKVMSFESVEKALDDTHTFADNYFKKLEARIGRFHGRMTSQVSIIETQRQLVETLRKMKRQRERKAVEKKAAAAAATTRKITPASKITTSKTQRRPEYYGSIELKNTIKDVKNDLAVLGDFKMLSKHFPEVKIPHIFEHFSNVLMQLQKSLDEIPLPEGEGNDDSTFTSETSGSSHSRP